MRTNTVLALLLASSLAACGGVGDDSDGMMDDQSGMMENASHMDDAMGSGAMGSDEMARPAMGQESSTMDDAMHDGSMARDTSQMRRP